MHETDIDPKSLPPAHPAAKSGLLAMKEVLRGIREFGFGFSFERLYVLDTQQDAEARAEEQSKSNIATWRELEMIERRLGHAKGLTRDQIIAKGTLTKDDIINADTTKSEIATIRVGVVFKNKTPEKFLTGHTLDQFLLSGQAKPDEFGLTTMKDAKDFMMNPSMQLKLLPMPLGLDTKPLGNQGLAPAPSSSSGLQAEAEKFAFDGS